MRSTDDGEETAPLYAADASENAEHHLPRHFGRKIRHPLPLCWSREHRITGVLFIYSLLTTALLLALTAYLCATTRGDYYSPAQTAIQYRPTRLHITDEGYSSPFSGTPSIEQLHAWEALSEPQFLQLTADELARSGVDVDTSVRIFNRSLYPASLGVYHELHCLKSIRKWYLLANLTETAIGDRDRDPDYRSRHLDHCLETLRLSLSCVPNLELYTWTYPADPANPHLDMHSVSPRRCANWDALHAWARSRSEGSSFVLEPRPEAAAASEDKAATPAVERRHLSYPWPMYVPPVA